MSKDVYVDWSKAPEGTTHAYISEPRHWQDGEPIRHSFFWEKWENGVVFDWRDTWEYWMEAEDTALEDRISKPSTEGNLVVNDQGGVKADSGKLEWTLLPWKSLKEIVEVLMYGNRKYPCPSNANWKKVEPDRYKKALMRHVVAWLDGEKVDEETGKSHLAHAGCCILFLLWFEVTGKLDD